MAANKVAIVTGANCGLGFRAAQMLCEKGLEVIMACRDEGRGQEAVKKLKEKQQDAKAEFMQLDLADLESVTKFAHTFLATGKPLHVLINNAGLYAIGGVEQRCETKDGFELHMGTNHIGHFLLTSLLLDKLKETGTPAEKARIVVVTSMLHNGTSRGHRKPVHDIDYDDLQLRKEGVYSVSQAYKNSKAANVMFSNKLARSLEGSNVTVNSLCPGFIPSTDLGRQTSWFGRFMLRWVLDGLLKPFVGVTRTLDHGAGLQVELAVDPKHEGESGQYYSDYKVATASEEVRNVENQERLWKLTKEIILEKQPQVKLMD